MAATFIWLLFTALASLILYLLSRKKLVVESVKLELPPGPNKLPIIGNLHQLGALLHRSLWSHSQKFGPLMHLQLGCVQTIVVSSATLAREVLKTQDLNFCNRPQRVVTHKFFYNGKDIVFSSYGVQWRELRKICILELFSAKRVNSFSTVRHEEISLMLKSISCSCSSSLPFNLSELMVSLMNNIVCRVSVGKKYQGEGEYKTGMFHGILMKTQALASSLFVSDYFPSMGWIDKLRGLHGQLEKIIRELDALYEEIIEEHLNPWRPKPEQEDIVDVLLRIEKDVTHITRDHIKAVLTDIFLAGTDTSSVTMIWVMTELARNPKVMRKAQEEVRDVIGTKGKAEEGDLHKLLYLKSVVKETLRLHPPAPLLLPHESMKHCKINGYDILPKTLVFVNAWAIGRDPTSWKDPEEFFPERFMDSTIDLIGQDFELIPFGSGRRSCPAMYFATLTIELVLANLLYSFNWKLPAGMKVEEIDMTEAPGMTVYKRSALHLVPSKYDI